MIITHASHLDHGLTSAQIAWILEKCKARQAFFIETFELPSTLPVDSGAMLRCGLFGPIMGDDPIVNGGFVDYKKNTQYPTTKGRVSYQVTYAKRGNRAGESRLVNLRPRPTNKLTVIAGPHEAYQCVLYTYYGGPLAPREPWELALSGGTPEQKAEAEAFWAVHALSKDA